MPSIRETKARFEELIRDLGDVRSGLFSEFRANKSHIEDETARLAQAIAVIVPELKPEFIELLDKAAAKAGTGHNFAQKIIDMHDHDKKTGRSIASLREQWSSSTPMIVQLADAQKNHRVTQELLEETRKSRKEILQARRKIDIHNEKYESSGHALTEKTEEKYRIFHLLPYIFNSSYRSGYKALRDYEPIHGNFVADIARLDQLNSEYEALRIKTDEQEEKLANLKISVIQINILSINAKGTSGILQEIRDTALQLAIDNEDFASALAAGAGVESGGQIVLSALKIRNLKKSCKAIEKQIRNVDQSLEQLEGPLPKLSRAVWRGGRYKHIHIDLNKIDHAITEQAGAIKKFTVNARNFRTSTSDYRPSIQNDNDLFSLPNMMLFYLLTQNNDPGYSHHILDITPSPESLHGMPDVSVPDLQGNFADSVQIPDVPSIDVPDIHVPDFSLDTSSFPDNSFGSGPDM